MSSRCLGAIRLTTMRPWKPSSWKTTFEPLPRTKTGWEWSLANLRHRQAQRRQRVLRWWGTCRWCLSRAGGQQTLAVLMVARHAALPLHRLPSVPAVPLRMAVKGIEQLRTRKAPRSKAQLQCCNCPSRLT